MQNKFKSRHGSVKSKNNNLNGSLGAQLDSPKLEKQGSGQRQLHTGSPNNYKSARNSQLGGADDVAIENFGRNAQR